MNEPHAFAIDVDDPSTWPPNTRKYVEAVAREHEGATESVADLPVGELEDEFRDVLTGHLVRAYHCTRLLDSEVERIRDVGLRVLSAELVRERLDRAARAGFLSDSEMNQLLEGNALVTRSGEGREGRTCLILSRCVFDEQPWAVAPLLATWGGESIYFTHAGVALEDRLTTIGRPAIVVVNVELPGTWRDHLVAPGVLSAFVGRLLELEGQGAEVHYRQSIPPEQVVDVWQPGHPEYDRHQGLVVDDEPRT